jgi:hypothetical protein
LAAPGRWDASPRGAGAREGRRKEGLLFLKKKKQKDFIHFLG